MFGWRARVGAVLPAVNTTLENESRQMLPDGVSFHAARFISVDEKTGEKVYAEPGINPVLETALTQVMATDPDLVALGCTTATFLHGVKYDAELSEELTTTLQVPFITAAGSVCRALSHLKARSIALVSPYNGEQVAGVGNFLNDAGIDVVAIGGPGDLDSRQKGQLPPWAPYRAVGEMDLSGVDAVFLSCTNWRTLEVIGAIEDRYHLPVISSNLALLWCVCAALNIRPAGPARATRLLTLDN